MEKETVKATELRIGNWVDGGHNGELFYPVKASDFVNTDFNRTKPIPLTPELLEKCGFVKKVDFGLDYFLMHPYRIEKWITDPFFSFRLKVAKDKSVALAEIEHLHQLQNLFFALTGEELPIKL